MGFHAIVEIEAQSLYKVPLCPVKLGGLLDKLSLVAIDSIGILSYCAWLVTNKGVDDTKGVDDDEILADGVDWFNTGDIPALAVAADESIDDNTEVFPTECGIPVMEMLTPLLTINWTQWVALMHQWVFVGTILLLGS